MDGCLDGGLPVAILNVSKETLQKSDLVISMAADS